MIEPKDIPMTADELRDALKTVAETATRTIGSCGAKSFLPILTVYERMKDRTFGLSIFALAMEFNTDDVKRNTMAQIGQGLYQRMVIPAGAVLAAERWMAPDPGPGKAASEHPERREAIVVFGTSMDSKVAGRTHAVIDRDADGRIRLGPFEDLAMNGVDGNVVKCHLLNYFFVGWGAVALARQSHN